MADRPLALRGLLAGHRNHRADLLGRERRRSSGPRRIGQPLRNGLPLGGQPPPLAPIPYRLRPHAEFPPAFAHTHPSAACRMTRARMANCCGVEWVRTNCSSSLRCLDRTITGSAADWAIAASHLRPRFVMPQHQRFDSSNLSQGQGHGVKTFARMYSTRNHKSERGSDATMRLNSLIISASTLNHGFLIAGTRIALA
jgi:hypothetical protein